MKCRFERGVHALQLRLTPALALCAHFSLTLRSLCAHSALTLRSLCAHSALTLRSLAGSRFKALRAHSKVPHRRLATAGLGVDAAHTCQLTRRTVRHVLRIHLHRRHLPLCRRHPLPRFAIDADVRGGRATAQGGQCEPRIEPDPFEAWRSRSRPLILAPNTLGV